MLAQSKLIALGLAAAANGLSWSASDLYRHAVLGAEPHPVLSNETLVPVGIAVACTIALAGLVWRAATAFQQISDRLGVVEREIREIKDACRKP